MSVLIKDMEMPKNCDECRFAYRGACIANIGREVKVDQICPLIEIPAPHGRLIDAKALTKDLGNRWNVNDDQDFCNKEVWHGIEEAPTVIGAEDGDSDV